jgi:hypothetical protein
MRTLVRIFALAGVLFTGLLVGPRTVAASEPGNDTQPHAGGWAWFNGMVSMYSTKISGTGAWPDIEVIVPSGDIDYHVLACAGRNISGVGITYPTYQGDIDIEVYGIDGTYIGGSYGVSGSEWVDISALSKQAVVMKVYGYLGATARYTVEIGCP